MHLFTIILKIVIQTIHKSKILSFGRPLWSSGLHIGFPGVAISMVSDSIPGRIDVENQLFYIASCLDVCGYVVVSDFLNTSALVTYFGFRA